MLWVAAVAAGSCSRLCCQLRARPFGESKSETNERNSDSVPADWSALCKGRPLTIILARSRGWVGGQGPGTSIGSSQTRVWLCDATNHRPVGFWLGHPPPSLSHASLLLLPTQPIRALVVYAKLRTWANICSVGN
jgi:hypothetical protein